MSGLNGTPRTDDVSVDTLINAPAHDDDTRERLRLEGEIVVAKLRAAAARERSAALDAEIEADSRSELVMARQTVEEMERDHAVAIAGIRNEAQAQAAEIVTEARLQAARLRLVSPNPEAQQVADA